MPAGAAFRSATASIEGWLAGLPHRMGARLFAMNDAEAAWHGWQVTELRGGLARSYRDSKFALLSALRACEAQAADLPDSAQAADLSKTVSGSPANGGDDMYIWPWDGEG